MRKILLSLAVIVAVGAGVAASTGAFFSDTETSTGNTFTAGAIDLQIDNTSYVTNADGVLVASPNNSWAISNLTNQLFFSFEDLKPGDIGEDTISVHAGSNNAYACMAATITATPDNGITDPEAGDGDVTDGSTGGELQNQLNFAFWNDDGDNVFEQGEGQITQWVGPASGIFNGAWVPIADSQNGTVIPGNSTRYIGKAWCFGTLTVGSTTQDGVGSSTPLTRGTTGFTCNGATTNNLAQTDGVQMDVSFYAVQARNNAGFLCSSLAPLAGSSSTLDVHQADLATILSQVVNDPTKWFFYNDTNDTIMTIDQFAGSGGQDHMESVAGSVGAKMLLDTGVNPRYNIATAKYGNVALSSITALSYRVYDTTTDSDKPFLHLNVDFTGSNTFQKRLVYVPTGLTTNTWTTVDTIQGGAGLWLYSGAFWPAGVTTVANTIPGTTARTWSSILADYPAAKTLQTGAFLGVRVGEPGPAAATGFVDYINFNGQMNDFVL